MRKAVLVSVVGAGLVFCLSLSGVLPEWVVCIVAVGQWDFSMDYARHGAVLITSILENTRNPVTVHIFHNEEIYRKMAEIRHVEYLSDVSKRIQQIIFKTGAYS